MSVSILVPTALRSDCGGAKELVLTASTVRGVLNQLEREYPTLFRRVCNETGSVRQHVNLFVNDDLCRLEDRQDPVLVPGDVLTIMPAVSGG